MVEKKTFSCRATRKEKKITNLDKILRIALQRLYAAWAIVAIQFREFSHGRMYLKSTNASAVAEAWKII